MIIRKGETVMKPRYRKEHKKRKLFCLENPVNTVILILLLSWFASIDAVSIYPIFEYMFFQASFISLFLTIGISVLLAGFTYAVAYYVRVESRANIQNLGLFLGIIGVFGIGGLLFVLRWSIRDTFFSSVYGEFEGGNLEGLGRVMETVEVSTGEVWMTILLACVPLFTSIIAISFACLISPTKQMDLAKVERIKDNKNGIQELYMAINRDVEEELVKELELFEIAERELMIENQISKNKVRQEVAKAIGTAEAVSELL